MPTDLKKHHRTRQEKHLAHLLDTKARRVRAGDKGTLALQGLQKRIKRLREKLAK